MINDTAAVELIEVSKNFGNFQAVQPTSLKIARNEFFSILGPSGCGKTTLMRMIAGFESLSSGSIELSGESVANTPTRKRDLNMLFQSYALFPHLTIFENVAFELRVRKEPKASIEKRVQEALALVRMSGYEKRRINQLSGGQKQRVALARAIVGNPSVVLLDEPLGALDKQLRKEMQFELKRLQREVGCTFIYVTHDQEEALSMSDRIAVMQSGAVHQIGTPVEIYDDPKTEFVASFIGECNFFQGLYDSQSQTIEVPDVGTLPTNPNDRMDSAKCSLIIRPEKIRLSMTQPSGWNLRGHVDAMNYLGDEWKIKVSINGVKSVLVSSNPTDEAVKALTNELGEIWISWEVNDSKLLLKEDEK